MLQGIFFLGLPTEGSPEAFFANVKGADCSHKCCPADMQNTEESGDGKNKKMDKAMW